ncbi:TPA: hypothetical protein N0F65_000234 [Lagenidium giganteum]|uniref:Protein kinase domain-containing protein n=1 Tax=Lagenidium giganteum TaxID=4803 RepID=A0AAV2YA24_9STRA|nr:TPA: hypothetical protein N0F65_000234 [Lagenidium giganteum]
MWKSYYNNTTVVFAKTLLQQNRHVEHEVALFVEEIKLSLTLSHPNIVYFLGVSWSSLDDLCLVMEHQMNGDLQSVLHSNGEQMAWAQHKLPMALGVARALMYLHGRPQQILHRDIRAKNVMLSKTFVPKLGEFGVSRHKVDETLSGGTGSEFWAAPEVLHGTRYSDKADVYSFGVLMNELDTCHMPYQNYRATMQPLQIIRGILDNSVELTFSDKCPSRVVAMARACLSPDPQERPRAHQVVNQLEQLMWAAQGR